MKHIALTCKNHPNLRWSCKEIAVKDDPKPGEPARYNGSRSIFFTSKSEEECPCMTEDLVIAPQD